MQCVFRLNQHGSINCNNVNWLWLYIRDYNWPSKTSRLFALTTVLASLLQPLHSSALSVHCSVSFIRFIYSNLFIRFTYPIHSSVLTAWFICFIHLIHPRFIHLIYPFRGERNLFTRKLHQTLVNDLLHWFMTGRNLWIWIQVKKRYDGTAKLWRELPTDAELVARQNEADTNHEVGKSVFLPCFSTTREKKKRNSKVSKVIWRLKTSSVMTSSCFCIILANAHVQISCRLSNTSNSPKRPLIECKDLLLVLHCEIRELCCPSRPHVWPGCESFHTRFIYIFFCPCLGPFPVYLD